MRYVSDTSVRTGLIQPISGGIYTVSVLRILLRDYYCRVVVIVVHEIECTRIDFFM